MSALRLVHALVSLLVAVAIPMAVYLMAGRAGAEIVVLGAVIGFAYWYWGPS
ncbi:hypothetical protein [Nitratireductor luteus]|uniref:hypothetical protein n=1 Tax=Nitratireductor luteus TaxID=2976980 RepID=UPI00223EDDA4|nr:hypothetical protein [Nitratireductor luteus]